MTRIRFKGIGSPPSQPRSWDAPRTRADWRAAGRDVKRVGRVERGADLSLRGGGEGPILRSQAGGHHGIGSGLRPDEPVVVSWDESPRSPSPGIEIDGRGRAVIVGTTVEAHRIAALLDGEMDIDEVVSDYITLTHAQVLAAKAYADEHPWTGEPYPSLTAKKAMREAHLDDLIPYLPRRAR